MNREDEFRKRKEAGHYSGLNENCAPKLSTLTTV